ncbi:MAG: protein translocase subunit SecD [Bacilli bacterium]
MKKKEKNSIIKSTLIIVTILLVMGLTTPRLLKSLKFGLDLQGGFEVLYEVQSIDGKKVTPEMVKGTYKTISKRIDVLGVSEPEIVIEGDNKIRVQLAGISNPTKARETLSSVANLSFRDTNNKLLMNSDVLKTGGAKVSQDEKGRPAVSLSIKDKDEFYRVTSAISKTEDKTIVIWLDYDGTTNFKSEQGKCGDGNSKCLSAATVSQGFSSDVIIQGNFTSEEVESLVNLINSGSLPTKLKEVSSKTVAASFGENSLELTSKAGIIGVTAIGLIMIAIFHFAGFIATIGIAIYTFLTFLSFWLFGGVLTLPGIAALVIGIGMAVDSCVISFSRIKDELEANIRLEGAYKKGNKNSFMAIFDANFTTLLVAAILFIFGESSVKGFATMLIISTIVTMLIMVMLTRFLLGLFVNTGVFNDKLNLFIGYKGKKERKIIDFIGMRKKAYIYMAIMVVIGITSLAINKLTLGIDFKGGSSINITSEEKLNITKLKKDIKDLGYTLYDSEVIDSNTAILKVTESFNKTEVLNTEELFTKKYDAKTDIGVISNIVKKDLVKNAFLAVLLSSLGIIVYVSLRFKFSYAISGIIALVHDAFLIIVAFSLFKIEVTSIFIAAILSIIGYSINDTIVTFDRIRENISKKRDNKVKSEEELANIVNKSITDTLARSIVSTVTTLTPVIALIAFGAREIINFNFALFVGLIAGVLSSIFIASQLWFDIEKRNIGKPAKKKWYEEED